MLREKLVLTMVVLGSTSVMSAASGTSAGVFACLGGNEAVYFSCPIYDKEVYTNPIQISASVGSPAQGATAVLSGSASAVNGTAKVNASISYNVTGSPANAYLLLDSGFSDDFTFNSSHLQGRQGVITYQFSLEGSIARSTGANGYLIVEASPGNSESNVLAQVFTSSFSGTSQLSYAQIQFGSAKSLGIALESVVGNITNTGDVFLYTNPTSGTGDASASGKLILTGFDVFDDNGSPVTDATLSTASGAQYAINGTLPSSVPEPSTLGLLIPFAGVSCLVGSRYRLSRRWRDRNFQIS